MEAQQFYSVHISDCVFQIPHRYIIESIIGGGGYGIVVKAYDPLREKHVAIKRLKTPFNHKLNAVRAYRELEILKIVDHKNIIRFLNAYTPQENLANFEEVYFVMEYMDYTLRVLINLRASQFEGPDGGRRMSFLIYQLLCGVNHLHQAKIMHRDLTPDNVLIDTKFNLKIADFGMARIDCSQDKTKNVMHQYYRAPEVFFSKNYDMKVDIWSIGCIFGELLTGAILFKGKSDFDQLFKIIDKMGSPNENIVSRLDDDALKNYLRSLPRRDAMAWEELFPNKVFPSDQKTKFTTASNGRKLISRMLVFDPEYRISVSEALDDSYVSWKRREEEIQHPPKGQYDGFFESHNSTTDEWKKIIFERIKEYQQTHHV